MDSNTKLAMVYRPDIPQIVNWAGIQWMHEPHGNWVPICEFGE